MAASNVNSEDLRERDTLSELLEKIPKKAQRALTTVDISLTCVDANQYFIVLGSNVGLVFQYNRTNQNLERLKCESYKEVVTCVQLHEGTEHQVAVGTNTGRVYMFQIFCLDVRQSKQTRLQKFVLDLHRQPVTCVQWSTNGMKLYSGSDGGTIVSTELDFSQGQCKSEQLLEENCPIVQLDYRHRALLISTTHRSFLCLTDQNNKLLQVGQKERKVTGPYGACFTNGLGRRDTYLFAARPGLRIWKANFEGIVESTFICKDLINSAHSEIPLLAYEQSGERTLSDFQFQKLKLLGESELVTWNEGCLCVMNPSSNSLVGSQTRIGQIQDLAVTSSEIILFRQGCERNLLRISKTNVKVEAPIPLSVRGPSPIFLQDTNDRQSKNRSPLNFLQKKLFNKLHKENEKELGIPLGVELDSPKNEAAPTGPWGPEDETLPRLIESGSTNGSNSDIHQPKAHRPVAKSNSVHSATELCADLPAIVIDRPATNSSSKGDKSVSDEKLPDNENSTKSARTDAFGNIDLNSTSDIVFSSNKIKKPKKKGKGKSSQQDASSEKLKSSDNDGSPGAITVNNIQGEETSAFARVPQKPPQTVQENIDKILVGKERAVSDTKMLTSSYDGISKSLSARTKDNFSDQNVTKQMCVNDVEHVKTEFQKVQKNSVGTENIPSLNLPKRLLSNDNECQKPASVIVSDRKESKVKTKDPVAIVDSSSKLATSPQVSSVNNSSQISSPTEASHNMASNQIESDKKVSISKGDKISSQTEQKKSRSSTDSNTDQFKLKASGSTQTLTESGANSKDKLAQDVKSGTICSETAQGNDLVSQGNVKDQSDSLIKNQLNQAALTLGLEQRNSQTEDIYANYSPEGVVSPGDQLPATDVQPSCTVTPSPPRQNSPEEAIKPRTLVDSWSKAVTPGIIQSLSLSQSHVWICDTYDQVYYSRVSGPGLSWKKLSVKGNQILVSPNGQILWRLFSNKAYVALKVSSSNPEGGKWMEVLQDITCIGLDNTTCWCFKSNGDVLVQGGLKRDRPTSKVVKVPCPYRLRQICCLNGVVWGLTLDRMLVARTGVSNTAPYGTDWLEEENFSDELAFLTVALGPNNIGWALDTQHNLKFCRDVCPNFPLGNRKWWQVSTEQLISEQIAAGFLEFSKKLNPKNLLKDLVVSQPPDTGLLAIQQTGTWLCMAAPREKTLNVCHSNVLGNHWTESQPLGMSLSTPWKLISAANAHLHYGSIWCQQSNGELFAFPSDALQFTKIELPNLGTNFVCVSVSKEAVWGLNLEGQVYVRAGMGSHCPLGATWVQQNLKQIGEKKIVCISCGGQTVWAVNEEGHVYQRLGVKSSSTYQLNPAWLPINSNNVAFKQVITGPLDYMVWGINNQGHLYTRLGITDSLPIGEEWVPVPGLKATQLCISNQTVWVLSPLGELFCRRGIQRNNIVGDYWQKIPIKKKLICISVSASDDLWCIDVNERIVHRETNELVRATTEPNLQTLNSESEGDWEIV